jgi:Maltogenic Amylase, C-terminal domain
VISRGPFGYEHVNAAQQRRDPNSMLNWTERIVRMRKEVPEVGWGDFEMLNTRNAAVLAIRYDWRDNSVLFVHNRAATPREVSFSVGLAGDDGQLLVDLLSENHSKAGSSGTHHLILEGYGYRWYRVGGLDYLVKRSDIETSSGLQRRGKESKSRVRRRRLNRDRVYILSLGKGAAQSGDSEGRSICLISTRSIGVTLISKRRGRTWLSLQRLPILRISAGRILDASHRGRRQFSGLRDAASYSSRKTPFSNRMSLHRNRGHP